MSHHDVAIVSGMLSVCLALAVCACDRSDNATEHGVVSVSETGHDVVVLVCDELGKPVENATVTYGRNEIENLGRGMYRARLLRPVGGLVVRIAVSGHVDVERRVPDDAVKRENTEIYDVVVFLSDEQRDR